MTPENSPGELSPVQQALVAVRDLRARLAAMERDAREPIAVLGMGCRFPGGSNSPEAFWDFLKKGGDAVREVPPDRWDSRAYYDPDPATPGKTTVRFGGFLDRVDGFDAEFFGISPREAASMDPQQRLLLQVAWEALEDGGQAIHRLAGTDAGVFLGMYGHDYAWLQVGSTAFDTHSASGLLHSVAANRLSYLLDVTGPSFTVDTACSSSLVAVHLACRSLVARECSLALAAGVHLLLSPVSAVMSSKVLAMAPDGRCKAFDARADGIVRAEGCAVLVLKRLSDAIAGGDPIRAVIRGSAVNQDGKTNGLTAPNVLSQKAVVRAALRAAGVEPSRIGFVEAHGTGTTLGDPIELEALADVFGRPRTPGHRLFLGAVKTNIGHAEAAAGVAALVKAVLAVEKGEIPPHLHFTRLNRSATFEDTPFEIPTRPEPWPVSGGKRRAGVSSFGVGGTNAHVVLEEAPEPTAAPCGLARARILPLSARCEPALRELARRARDFLAAPGAPDLGDVTCTASVRRTHYEHRLAVVGETPGEIAGALGRFLDGDPGSGVVRGHSGRGARPVLFVFSGQGAQRAGMGRELLEDEPVFRAALERCDAVVRSRAGFGVVEEILAAGTRSRLDRTRVAQPALVSFQFALTELLRSFGIAPSAVIGHSAGEIAAALVSGALSLADSLELAIRRGELMERRRGLGRMAALEVSLERAREIARDCGGRLGVAGANGPSQTVISGEPEAVAEAVRRVREEGLFARELEVDYAFHGREMSGIERELPEAVRGLVAGAASVPFFSTVTGVRRKGEELGPEYWGSGAREPVEFRRAVESALAEGFDLFVEVGAHPVLSRAIAQTAEDAGREIVVVPTLSRKGTERRAILGAVASLYVAGAGIDWRGLHPEGGRCVRLPSYPWQESRHWIEPTELGAGRVRGGEATGHPLVGSRLASPLEAVQFETEIGPASPAWLSDHRIHGSVVVPAAAIAEAMLAANLEALGAMDLELADLALLEPIVLSGEGTRVLQIVLFPAESGGTPVRLHGCEDGSTWRLHATATLRRPGPLPEDLAARSGETLEDLPSGALYASLAAMGIEYGPAFRGLAEVRRGKASAEGRILPPEALAACPEYLLHPALLDACLQVFGSFAAAGSGEAHVPVGFARYRILRPRPVGELRCRVRFDEGSATGDLAIHDERGELVAVVEGARFRKMAREAIAGGGAGRARDWLHELAWREIPVPSPSAPAPRRWLVLGGGRTGERFAERARAAGERVLSGDESALRAADVQFDRVLFFPGAGSESDPVVRALRLFQALAANERTSPVRVWFATRGAQILPGDATGSLPVDSVLWGWARIAFLEHPERAGGLIDLDREDGSLLYDVVDRYPEEDEIAIRAGRLLVPRLGPWSAPALPAGPASFSPEASYLVTGGLGGIGLLVARWLVERGARRLALVSRSAPSSSAQAIHRDLEAAGARVLVLAGDVSREEDVRRVLREVEGAGPLRGVFHAAGVLDDALLADSTPERLLRVLAPKARGAILLDRLCEGLPLEHFVLFSSAAALGGSPGQSAYGGANLFLDSLAAHRRSRGLPALSVAWGPWEGVGMAAGTPERSWRTRGIDPIPPGAALDLLGRLLASGRERAVVLGVDRSAFGFAPGRVPSVFREMAAAAPARGALDGSLARLLEGNPPARRPEVLKARLREEFARVMGLPPEKPIEPRRGFFEMGMDSLLALELRNRLQDLLGRPLPATVVLENPTLEALGHHLAVHVLALEVPRAGPAAQEGGASAEAAARIAALSEEEAEGRLVEKLAQLDRGAVR